MIVSVKIYVTTVRLKRESLIRRGRMVLRSLEYIKHFILMGDISEVEYKILKESKRDNFEENRKENQNSRQGSGSNFVITGYTELLFNAEGPL